MAHDGQDMTMHRVILDDLIGQTGAALLPLDQLLETATAAVRAQVPILPMFIGVSHPYLMKGVPFWHVPDSTPLYTFEQLPVIETAGKTSRDVARDLTAHYEARFDALLAERER